MQYVDHKRMDPWPGLGPIVWMLTYRAEPIAQEKAVPGPDEWKSCL